MHICRVYIVPIYSFTIISFVSLSKFLTHCMWHVFVLTSIPLYLWHLSIQMSLMPLKVCCTPFSLPSLTHRYICSLLTLSNILTQLNFWTLYFTTSQQKMVQVRCFNIMVFFLDVMAIYYWPPFLVWCLFSTVYYDQNLLVWRNVVGDIFQQQSEFTIM